MDLVRTIHNDISKMLVTYLGKDVFASYEEKIIVERCRQNVLGDYATNAALVLSKVMKKPPMALAQELELLIKKLPYVKNVRSDHPGFLNLTLSEATYISFLMDPSTVHPFFCDENKINSLPLNLEFVSANPTGPLHAGHGRIAIFGDILGNILGRFGYKVSKEYYINDAGGQIDSLVWALYWRYLALCDCVEQLPSHIKTQDLYQGEYIISMATILKKSYGHELLHQKNTHWFDTIRSFALEHLMNAIKEDLALLGVGMDEYVSEKNIHEEGALDKVLNLLEKKDMLYNGILPKPKNLDEADDWEERSQLLFRSTDHGDDIDRALKKSDGSWTYFAGDVAYHHHKIERGYKHLINIFGADHIGYVKRLQAAIHGLDPSVYITIKCAQLVNFLENGVPVRMSKRSGNFITIQDVINRVGKDATRFMMIARASTEPIDFDFCKVLEQSKDNPIFYIQYAHARGCSVWRHATTLGYSVEGVRKIVDQMPTAQQESLLERALVSWIQIIIDWPHQLSLAIRDLEPYRITNYLYELVSQFHQLWNMGKEKAQLRFILPGNEPKTAMHLLILSTMMGVMRDALELLGITPIEEMR
jgi:arginyl-tRNA synthetase